MIFISETLSVPFKITLLARTAKTLSFQDKKYATDKYKDIYTELSIVKAKGERDLGRLRDQLQLAHEALGEPSLEQVDRGGGYGRQKQTGYLVMGPHAATYF